MFPINARDPSGGPLLSTMDETYVLFTKSNSFPRKFLCCTCRNTHVEYKSLKKETFIFTSTRNESAPILFVLGQNLVDVIVH